MPNTLTKDIFEIAALLVGVTMLSMLVLNASQTTQVITASGDTFAKLLNTAAGRGFA